MNKVSIFLYIESAHVNVKMFWLEMLSLTADGFQVNEAELPRRTEVNSVRIAAD